MISVEYVQRMARYNRWQNENLYTVADGLSEQERRRQRGAFFGSIQATLEPSAMADHMWMSRFAGTPRPEGGIPQSVSLYEDWSKLKRERAAFDATSSNGPTGSTLTWLEGDLTYYSGAAKRDLTRPRSLLVMHFFNHQTHHRGQVHCMLTQAGGQPQATDLPLTPT
jgi:uncharacterized damage-inducible protein DinB